MEKQSHHNQPAGELGASLNARAQSLLRSLIMRYIEDGQPVGSRVLSRDSGLDLSPATVRNVISDLEDLGLVTSPHTSSGRVPTVLGYRLFVDTLLQVKPPMTREIQRLRVQLEDTQDREQLVMNASAMLSEITHLAGVVTIPKPTSPTLRQVEFLSLSNNQVLVILVVNEQEVQNRIITTSRSYSASELQQAGNYLTAHFRGADLHNVRGRLVAEMREAREAMNQMMLDAIVMAEKAFEPEEQRETVMVAGQTHLMEYGDLADMEKLRNLFDAFNSKRDILHLLDQSLSARGVQIFIGEESGYSIFDDCSVVAAPYEVDGDVLGVLGVIGPTRMAYERVIPIVDITARLFGAALNAKQ
jgi:heat-inducible transcriptional repressor